MPGPPKVSKQGEVIFDMKLTIPRYMDMAHDSGSRTPLLTTETAVGDGTACCAKFQLQVTPYYKKNGTFKTDEDSIYFYVYLKLVSCDKERVHVDYRFRVPDYPSVEYSVDFNVGNRHGIRFKLAEDQIVKCHGKYYYEKAVKESSVLVSHMELLLEEHSHCDVTLTTLSGSRPAHKAILTARSPVFKDMLEDCQTGNLNMEDVEYEVLKEMLRYVYTGKWPEQMASMTEQLLSAANKYGLDDLKAICERHYAEGISVKNVVRIMVLADTHAAENLKTAAQQFIQQHIADVVKTKEWKDMFFSHPAVAHEIANFLSNYVMH